MAQLLGPDGKPMKQQALTTMVAEGGTTGVRKSFGDSEASGLTPTKLASILTDCDAGDFEAFMTLAEEMEERDPHYMSVLGQRKRAISGIEPQVKAASEDKRDEEIAAWVRENIAEHFGFADLVEDLMDAVGKGFSVVEIDWLKKAESWTISEFIPRTQRFFQIDKETGRELRLRDEQNPEDGLELNRNRLMVHRAKLKSGHMFRGGIARVVAFSWMCKAYTLKDWMAFVEMYGLPLRLGRYGPEATKEDVNVLFRAVANIGTDAAAVLPKFMDIEFVDNKSGGGTQPIFENLARYIDEQVSKAVLGQTMTTDDGSSMAQAVVHNDVRLDVAQADARAVAGTINRELVRRAVVFNFGPQEHYPTLKIVVPEPEDTKMIVDAVVALAGAGVKFRASEMRAKLGASDPEEGDEVFGGAPASDEPKPTKAETARNRSGEPDGDADLLDEIERDMLADWENTMGEMLEPIDEALAAARSYDEFMVMMEGIGGLPKSNLVDTLVRGTFAARAAGDVRDG